MRLGESKRFSLSEDQGWRIQKKGGTSQPYTNAWFSGQNQIAALSPSCSASSRDSCAWFVLLLYFWSLGLWLLQRGTVDMKHHGSHRCPKISNTDRFFTTAPPRKIITRAIKRGQYSMGQNCGEGALAGLHEKTTKRRESFLEAL